MKTLTLAAILTGMISLNVNANEQQYTFTYDFAKPQDEVVQLASHTSQMVQYEAMLDIIYSAYNAIQQVGKETEEYELASAETASTDVAAE